MGAAAPHADSPGGPSRTGRSIQLPRWFLELAGWLERRQKRMVLSGAWQGLPESGRWLRRRRRRRTKRAVRLRCWICQLDGRLERRQEGLVLFEQGQGLPTSSWRMCLRLWLAMTVAPAFVPSSGATVVVLLGSSLPAQASEDSAQC